MLDETGEAAMIKAARKIMGRQIAKGEIHTYIQALAETPPRTEIDPRQHKKLIRRLVNERRKN
jgi:hypothetical protein